MDNVPVDNCTPIPSLLVHGLVTPDTLVLLYYCLILGLIIETYRELRPRWKLAEKSGHFLGKIEGESSLPVIYFPCYHSR